MPDNSGGFVVSMCFIAEILREYKGDHADVYLCDECKMEFRWKDYKETPFCIHCGSLEFKLIRKKSEF
jgi:hypothetical protein